MKIFRLIQIIFILINSGDYLIYVILKLSKSDFLVCKSDLLINTIIIVVIIRYCNYYYYYFC